MLEDKSVTQWEVRTEESSSAEFLPNIGFGQIAKWRRAEPSIRPNNSAEVRSTSVHL